MEDFSALLRRMDFAERSLSDHAKTLTALVEEQHDEKTVLSVMEIEKAVRVERDKHLDERLTRIEKSIQGLMSIGKYILIALGSTLVAAIANFLLKGGLHAVG